MPPPKRSLLNTSELSILEIEALFDLADVFAARGREHGPFYDASAGSAPPRGSRLVACLFFEPRTRKRLSFQTAAHRLGWGEIAIEAGANSSLIKGETLTDTVLNVAAMGPDLLVVRYGHSQELDWLLPTLSTSVINAGSGVQAHPTQALLDAYTIRRERGQIKDERVLIAGDVAHSRVARSNFELLPRLGAEVAMFGPQSFLPPSDHFPHVKRFTRLEEGLEWATVAMGLRIQLERHKAVELDLQSFDDYHRKFGFSSARLEKFRCDGILMHPGPINHGVEFAADAGLDSRSRVLAQVTNGVLVRAALMSFVLEGSTPRTAA